MNPIIVSKNEPITLVGGAEISSELFFLAQRFGPRIIAADGGAASVLGFGAVPEVIIGDLDSVTEADLTKLRSDQIISVSEQESTDFDKVLQRVDAPLFLGVGFLGSRIDHELAALSSLMRFAHKKVILIGEQDIIFVLPAKFSMSLELDERVSLFPMSETSVKSRGLYWPTDGLTFHPMSQIGTSNKATGPIELTTDQVGMLMILPKDYLAGAIDALAAAPSWSV